VAEALYGAGDDSIDLLARHLYLGEAGAKALDYLVRAGERAKRLFANEEAILHLQRAAEVAEADTATSGRLPEIQLSIADLYELVGSYDKAIELYSAVRDETADVRAWTGVASTLREARPARINTCLASLSIAAAWRTRSAGAAVATGGM